MSPSSLTPFVRLNICIEWSADALPAEGGEAGRRGTERWKLSCGDGDATGREEERGEERDETRKNIRQARKKARKLEKEENEESREEERDAEGERKKKKETRRLEVAK